MKVWLDDTREMPERYDIWAKTANQAIELLKTKKVTEISLDHDLADPERDGYEVACWIESQAYAGELPPLTWKVHSQNVVGAKRIRNALKQANRYWGI